MHDWFYNRVGVGREGGGIMALCKCGASNFFLLLASSFRRPFPPPTLLPLLHFHYSANFNLAALEAEKRENVDNIINISPAPTVLILIRTKTMCATSAAVHLAAPALSSSSSSCSSSHSQRDQLITFRSKFVFVPLIMICQCLFHGPPPHTRLFPTWHCLPLPPFCFCLPLDLFLFTGKRINSSSPLESDFEDFSDQPTVGALNIQELVTDRKGFWGKKTVPSFLHSNLKLKFVGPYKY